MENQIRFSVPLTRNGAPLDFIAYQSQRRKDAFIVAECAGVRNRPSMSVFTPLVNSARHEYPNFTQLHLNALRDDDGTVLGVEVYVLWRGMEKFKARYSINDCDSEIIFNRWGK